MSPIMLTSTIPRSPEPMTRAPHPPPTFYKLTASHPSSQATITTPASSPETPSRGRQASISKPMHWLSRGTTQSSTPYAPSKPTRISEPKLLRSTELFSRPRSGALGSGATVVRTPEDALRETFVRLTFNSKAKEDQSGDKSVLCKTSMISDSQSPRDLSPDSPRLPPLPLPQEDEFMFFEAEREAYKQSPRPTPTRTLPHPPVSGPSHSPSLRSSLQSKPMSGGEDVAQALPLPTNTPTSPIPSPFQPILMSEVPTGAVDHSKIIVTLETCTTTYRTTLDTLRSRPSYLSSYVSSLFPKSPRTSIASSVYSTATDDISIYRHHLASRGLLPQSSFNIRIFLDRPSVPYAHILNYLRSPVTSPDVQESLPRSIYRQTSSHLLLQSLLDLRDEAAYVNLHGLHRLCTEEIRLRQGSRLHRRGHSTGSVGSVHSLHPSVYGLHTLLERVENDLRSHQYDSKTSNVKESQTEMGVLRSPPTPQSLNGLPHERSQSRCSPSRSPPAGWI